MGLRSASLLYLYAPLAVFVAGWLRPLFALPLLVAMGAAAIFFRPWRGDQRPRRRVCAVAALIALLWTALSGAGGVGHQRDDWLKHNAVLKDLIEKDWPPAYEVGPEEARTVRPLVFYIAYYLPAALVGKVAGWGAANGALFLWTWLGSSLVLLWFARLVGAGAGAMVFFTLAGGVEIVGYVLGKGYAPPGPLALDWWSYPWNLATNSGHLFWAPHQALGGWLATALVLDGHLRRDSTAGATLEAFGAAFWSPFAMIGILPFWCLRVLRAPRAWLSAWPNWSLFPIFAAILAAYYASVHQPVPVEFLGDEIFGRYWIRHALLVVLEWGALLFLSRPSGLPSLRPLAWIAAGSLALIPFLSMGLFNDFCMRVSIPALFVLWLVVGRRLFGAPLALDWGWRWAAALGLAAFLGTAGAVLEAKTSLRGARLQVPNFERTPEVHATYENRRIGWQYLGEPEAFFFRRLARRGPS